MTSSQNILDALLDEAREHESPCGEGRMVWRSWGDDTLPIVVLLHGGFGAWNHWVRNIAALAETHHVIAPDLPGCGDSADPAGHPDAISLAAILSAGLDLIVPGDASFDLVGFSFGGQRARAPLRGCSDSVYAA